MLRTEALGFNSPLYPQETGDVLLMQKSPPVPSCTMDDAWDSGIFNDQMNCLPRGSTVTPSAPAATPGALHTGHAPRAAIPNLGSYGSQIETCLQPLLLQCKCKLHLNSSL